MNIGLVIRKIRKRQSLTQKELAESCYINQGFLCSIENGKREASVKTLKIISKKLRTPIALMFWHTLTQDDVPESKKEIYKQLIEPTTNLIEQMFTEL